MKAALLCLLLTGCATSQTKEFCGVAHPIPTHCNADGCDVRDATHDYYSPDTVNAILAHNRTGEKLCGW